MFAEPIACVLCTFPRTARVGDRRVCFQCRFSWYTTNAAAHRVRQAPIETEATRYAFTPSALDRLRRYRAAVRAGFYTDALTSRYRCSSQVSATSS